MSASSVSARTGDTLAKETSSVTARGEEATREDFCRPGFGEACSCSGSTCDFLDWRVVVVVLSLGVTLALTTTGLTPAGVVVVVVPLLLGAGFARVGAVAFAFVCLVVLDDFLGGPVRILGATVDVFLASFTAAAGAPATVPTMVGGTFFLATLPETSASPTTPTFDRLFVGLVAVFPFDALATLVVVVLAVDGVLGFLAAGAALVIGVVVGVTAVDLERNVIPLVGLVVLVTAPRPGAAGVNLGRLFDVASLFFWTKLNIFFFSLLKKEVEVLITLILIISGSPKRHLFIESLCNRLIVID